MPYTLAKFFLWGLLMALAGGVVGWLLRSVTSRRQLAKARASNVDAAEVDRLRHRLANLEPVVAERDRLRMELADVRGRTAGALGFSTTVPVDEPEPNPEPSATLDLDLDAGRRVLGRGLELDDLEAIEGIGPKIAELCRGIGVTSWAALAATDDAVLRSMLRDAGSRFAVHDPTSWPQQAALLAAGQWEAFKALTDELDGGR